ncbi:glycosyltransferase family 4 protein [Bacillus sp. RO1]|uniref:glycosyltransferase family 4 protein n=1 Tax=Bacillus sp. RO1 TaxID=2722703 RepID=UPI001456EDD7|nr:glycosyltransferase family 4 protein [Bacillus sp. RO1]NLP52715.1 glycosyltransferase family 4 protein [Bacillus sp. RO1]
MKKILIVSNMYPSEKHPFYGIFVKEQVEELKKNHDMNIDLQVITNKETSKIQSIFKYLSLWKRVFQTIIRQKFDIIHIHYIFPTALFVPIAKKITNAKLIGTIHGTNILFSKGLKYKIAKRIFNDLDEIVTVSDFVKEQLIKNYHVQASKVTTSNCGVNRTLFNPQDKLEMKQRLGLDTKKFHVLYLGRVSRNKGIFTFLELIKHCKDPEIEFIILGDGADKETVKSEIANFKNVKIFDGKPKTEVPDWFNAADLFVFPTKKEAFGLVALESLSCNTPVIGTDVGGVGEVIRHGENGYLVKEDDWESILTHVLRLKDNPDLYKSMVDKCDIDLGENEIHVQVNKLTKLYRSF